MRSLEQNTGLLELDHREQERLWGHIDRTGTACWEWTGCLNHNGYGRFFIRGCPRPAHRVMYQVHSGPIPSGQCVLHTCDNRRCVNPAHLWLGSNDDNVADKVAKGREARVKGVANGRSKLTPEEVAEIRRSADRHAVLARRFGVSSTTIKKIKRGELWRAS